MARRGLIRVRIGEAWKASSVGCWLGAVWSVGLGRRLRQACPPHPCHPPYTRAAGAVLGQRHGRPPRTCCGLLRCCCQVGGPPPPPPLQLLHVLHTPVVAHLPLDPLEHGDAPAVEQRGLHRRVVQPVLEPVREAQRPHLLLRGGGSNHSEAGRSALRRQQSGRGMGRMEEQMRRATQRMKCSAAGAAPGWRRRPPRRTLPAGCSATGRNSARGECHGHASSQPVPPALETNIAAAKALHPPTQPLASIPRPMAQLTTKPRSDSGPRRE